MWETLDEKKPRILDLHSSILQRAALLHSPYSTVELRLSDEEIRSLGRWFATLDPKVAGICFGFSLPLDDDGDLSVPLRAVVGGLLVVLGAEICRAKSRQEDAVWPSVKSCLSEPSQRVLFLADGQPNADTKQAIQEGIQALGLRHVFDVEGTQQWYASIKLQLGFTLAGARKRLAEWLVGLNPPLAVQYLVGNSLLASPSFRALWTALRQYRQGHIDDEQVREVLVASPWIRADWIDMLLDQARARIETLGVGERDWTVHAEAEAYEDAATPVQRLLLVWPLNGQPTLHIELDTDAVSEYARRSDADELCFEVDGQRTCTWFLERDGHYDGPNPVPSDSSANGQSNLTPRELRIVTDTEVEVGCWDLSDFTVARDVLVFDLDHEGELLAESIRLLPNRQYAILCDSDCNVEDSPVQRQYCIPGTGRKLLGLGTPLSSDLKLIAQDYILWQPLTPEKEKGPAVEIVPSENTSMPLFLAGARCRLLVSFCCGWGFWHGTVEHGERLTLRASLAETAKACQSNISY